MKLPTFPAMLAIPDAIKPRTRWRRPLGRPALALLAAAVVAGALFPGVAAAEGCTSVPGGPPGPCSGVASPGGGGGADAGAGNPINVMTGNKYQREDDMPALPGVLGLEIVRHYNSAYSRPGNRNGPFGRGWRLSYETELFDKFGRIQLLLADGGRVIFNRDPKAPDLCSTTNPANGSMLVDRQPNGLYEYTWTWTDGRKLHFNNWGKLDRITAATGETVRLYYDSLNVLVRVVDPQGRSLNLVYFDPKMPDHFHGVQFIDSPVGRFAYDYGSSLPKGSELFDKQLLLANLVSVRLPTGFDPDTKAHPLTSRGTTTSAIRRIYHHEDPKSPWVMTGISVETAGSAGKPVTSRYATYGYDGDARAILSTHAGNAGKVTLDASEAGKTVLTNSLGQKTVYRHTLIVGEHRLLEVRGAGCALCGEPNMRYGYNAAGQPTETTKLTDDGKPIATTRTELDKLGRPVRISKSVYRDGKPGPAQLQLRFEYQGAAAAPAVIARPSVVPGREVITRIQYNDAGQPLSVTETGWTPDFEGKLAVERIERTTSYRYARINGNSVLTQIDGPLPNGKTNSPSDSDITVIEYDHLSKATAATGGGVLGQYEQRQGLLSRIIAPGNFITEVLERDHALRPIKLRTLDGGVERVTSLRSDWRGAPVDIETAAGPLRRRLHYDYTATGQVAAITMPGNLRMAFEYDPAGRVSKTFLPDGSGMLTLHDTEDRTERTARFLDARGTIAHTLPDLRYVYERPADKPARLSRVEGALGLVKSYRYDDVGQVFAITNALGISSRFDYDGTGLLAGRTDAAGSADAATVSMDYDSSGHATRIVAPNGVTTMRRYDDFGRKVMEADPDHGATLSRYDAAGRMLVRIDETGVATRHTYDHAGRLLAMGADQQANLLQYQYRGRELVSVVSTTDGKPEHATERTEYLRDGFGRVIKETRWLAKVTPTPGDASPGLTFVTTSDYDEAGRLVSQVLPDGHRLQYRYAAAVDGGGARTRSRPGQLEAILFDGSVVVTDIEQSIAGGMTGYTMSNGVRQRIAMDREGRIERLQVLADSAAGHAGWWHRLKAWVSGAKLSDAPLYQQVNRYDASGRITQIDRTLAATESGRTAPARTEKYSYDAMNRLASIRPGAGPAVTFGYDKAGNRISETAVPAAGRVAGTGAAMSSSAKHVYRYAPGTNRLIAEEIAAPVTDRADGKPGATGDLVQWLRSAWFYHPTGVQLAQLKWSSNGRADDNRRIVYNTAKRPVAVYAGDQPIARYHYNSQGERIAKTVFAPRAPLTAVSYAHAQAQGKTTYTLYRDQRLAAETDSEGQITAHYIYLYGKPVAKVEMTANESWLHRVWKSVTMQTGTQAGDTQASVYAIVGDHLGTPQQVFDGRQRLIWQADTGAYGQARVTFAAASGANGGRFVMNLRLPGQIFDAETGLHYNYLRDYDPSLGRYMTPDPLGLDGGINSYAYVANDPLTGIDPLGLYQIDIHYYMTFFLAMAAGVDYDKARTMALAAQYIDDNPDTRPLDASTPWTTVFSPLSNQGKLLSYHFVLSDSTGRTIRKYNNADLGLPVSDVAGSPGSDSELAPQLKNLLDASKNAQRECAKLQFFGEYLHAFEDTFSHRNRDNIPYDALQLGAGIGHGLPDGSEPDYTYADKYDGDDDVIKRRLWFVRPARTLKMEEAVYKTLVKHWGDSSKAKSWEEVKKVVEEFNNYRENENTGLTEKIDLLNGKLKEWSYKARNPDDSEEDIDLNGADAYRAAIADENRKKNLCDKDRARLKQGDFPGTILPTTGCPK